ncbi:hypothetical protein ACEPAF_8811 [Sanghuangporus sanghuang]
MHVDTNGPPIVGAKSDSSTMDPSPNHGPPFHRPHTEAERDQQSTPRRVLKRSPPNVQATNYLSINYRMPISGTYVIDPGLDMPADLVSDNPTKKANLLLQCTRGSITADIWLVDAEGQTVQIGNGSGQRAVIDVLCKSWMGKVDVKTYALTMRPFSLTVTLNGGNISVALPSDFVGPITLSTGSLYDSLRLSSFTPFSPSGVRDSRSSRDSVSSSVRTVPYSTSIVFSGAVQSRLVTFSEGDGKMTCFIGDYRRAGYTSRKDWTGSLVNIQSGYGSLMVSFVDEVQDNEEGSGCILM